MNTEQQTKALSNAQLRIQQPLGNLSRVDLPPALHNAVVNCIQLINTLKEDGPKSSDSLNTYCMVQLAMYTGARMSEIESLMWDEVDFRKRRIPLRDHKSTKRRPVGMRMDEQVKQMLKNHRRSRRLDTPYVFPSKSGTKAVDWRRVFRAAASAANMADFKLSDLRITLNVLFYGHRETQRR